MIRLSQAIEAARKWGPEARRLGGAVRERLLASGPRNIPEASRALQNSLAGGPTGQRAQIPVRSRGHTPIMGALPWVGVGRERASLVFWGWFALLGATSCGEATSNAKPPGGSGGLSSGGAMASGGRAGAEALGGAAEGGAASGSGGNSASGGISASAGAASASGGILGSGATSASAGADGLPAQPIGQFECDTGAVPEVPNTRLKNWQYANTVRDLLGVTTVEGRPIADVLYADTDGVIVEDAARAYHDVAEAIAEEVIAGPLRSRFIACDPNAACLQQTIRDFGRKAYRRPLSEDEVTTLAAGIPTETEGAAGLEAARHLLATFLVSTPFLYRDLTEQPPDANGKVLLTPYALATRLSYLVLGSTPDAILSAAADAGELATDAQVRAQVARLMQDPRAHEGTTRFHRTYLGIDNPSLHWFMLDHDPTLYPTYAKVRPSAAEEIKAFFDAVTFDRGTFADLFLSNIGFVNTDSAPIYGLDPSNFGSDLTRVALDAQQRPGFMTRIGFLASYSGYTTTSPIMRGTYVTSAMLGLRMAPPPVSSVNSGTRSDFATQRKYIEALYDPPSCKPCHAYIGPPGYVFENYDAIGAWQTVDRRGGTIDAVADVFLGARSKTIHSPFELMSELARSQYAQRRYADALTSYALERAPNARDACLSEELARKLESDVPLLDLWGDVAASELFRSGTR